jgi:hypothetical protein
MFTFHKSVIGHVHILKDIPCEDYSASFSEKNGRYHIAIVADGHGSEECFRSAFGSKAAVDIALAKLKDFAEAVLESPGTEERFYCDIFTNPRYQAMTMRQLTDSIISRWHDYVEEDYQNNPPTEDELQKTEEHSNREANNVAQIYGTTLMAALWLPCCLLVVHQGDGRCDVFYDDGTVDQPVPWDKRCVDTAVTSLCDEDALTSIRHCVLNIIDKKIIACYLGSDGVEDAYRDTYEAVDGKMHSLMGGVHTFYKDLTCQLGTKSQEDFNVYLTEMLPKFSANGRFSRTGSGDDISVAGIVDIKAVRRHIDQFKVDTEIYDLEEQLFWKEDELRGKMRKHGILHKRMDEAKAELEVAKGIVNDTEMQPKTYITKIVDLKIKAEKYLEAKSKFEEYDATYIKIEEEKKLIQAKIEEMQKRDN